MLDPFRPERSEDVDRLKALQAQIHDHFIDHVKSRRGSKLSTDRDLFTGEIFVGSKAVHVGLVDGIAHMVPKLKSIYGENAKLTYLGQRRPLLQRLVPGLLSDVVGIAEERAFWARFGL